jgi:hypothetical protein
VAAILRNRPLGAPTPELLLRVSKPLWADRESQPQSTNGNGFPDQTGLAEYCGKPDFIDRNCSSPSTRAAISRKWSFTICKLIADCGGLCLRHENLQNVSAFEASEIDRRLAAGEPTAQVARGYEINLSSLHRHRVNCLKHGSANDIKKEASRGSAAVAPLPDRERLGSAYRELRNGIVRSRRRRKPKAHSRSRSLGSTFCGRRSILWHGWRPHRQ